MPPGRFSGGSYARGDAHPGSDVDLIVIVDTGLGRFDRYQEYTWPLVTALDGLLPEEPNRTTTRVDLDISSHRTNGNGTGSATLRYIKGPHLKGWLFMSNLTGGFCSMRTDAAK